MVSFSSGLFHQRTSQNITRFFSEQIFCTCQWILMKISLYNKYGDQICIFYLCLTFLFNCSFSDTLYQTHTCIYSWHNEPQNAHPHTTPNYNCGTDTVSTPSSCFLYITCHSDYLQMKNVTCQLSYSVIICMETYHFMFFRTLY